MAKHTPDVSDTILGRLEGRPETDKIWVDHGNIHFHFDCISTVGELRHALRVSKAATELLEHLKSLIRSYDLREIDGWEVELARKVVAKAEAD